MDAEGEVVNSRLLSAEIEDSDLGVGDTTVEPRLGVRLEKKKMTVVSNLIYRYFHDLIVFVQIVVRFPRRLQGPGRTFQTHIHPPQKEQFRRSIIISLPCSCSTGSNGRDVEPFCRYFGVFGFGVL